MSSDIVSYRDLVVWQRAMDLVDLVYTLTDSFPNRERFGLAFQMRKTAVSIPSIIAEGTRHRTPGYLSRVVIALGEHAELETQVLIGHRRGFVSKSTMAVFAERSESVGQLAHGLARSLEARIATAPK